RRRPEQCSRRLLGGSARLGSPTEIPDLVVIDRVGLAVERWRRLGTEARGIVVPERRDELKEWSLRVRECRWSRNRHTGAGAGGVALQLRIVAVIASTLREHRIGSGFADHDS